MIEGKAISVKAKWEQPMIFFEDGIPDALAEQGFSCAGVMPEETAKKIRAALEAEKAANQAQDEQK